MDLDRRIIWLGLAIIFIVSLVFPFRFRGAPPSEPVEAAFRAVDSLPERSAVLLTMDFAPSFSAELVPMAEAVCRHAFRKNLRVVGITLIDSGAGQLNETIRRVARETGKIYGVDYAVLGWQPSDIGVITGMTVSIPSVFPKDFSHTPLNELPVMRDIYSLKNFSLIANIGAGFESQPKWLAYGSDKTGVRLIIGCNAGAEASIRPFYVTGQVSGLIPAIRGAAEYEQLLREPGMATNCVNAISIAQLLMIVIIIAANIKVFGSLSGFKNALSGRDKNFRG